MVTSSFRIHQCINIGMIAHKLNMEAEAAAFSNFPSKG